MDAAEGHHGLHARAPQQAQDFGAGGVVVGKHHVVGAQSGRTRRHRGGDVQRLQVVTLGIAHLEFDAQAARAPGPSAPAAATQ
jgi:hypothetical protein